MKTQDVIKTLEDLGAFLFEQNSMNYYQEYVCSLNNNLITFVSKNGVVKQVLFNNGENAVHIKCAQEFTAALAA